MLKDCINQEKAEKKPLTSNSGLNTCYGKELRRIKTRGWQRIYVFRARPCDYFIPYVFIGYDTRVDRLQPASRDPVRTGRSEVTAVFTDKGQSQRN